MKKSNRGSQRTWLARALTLPGTLLLVSSLLVTAVSQVTPKLSNVVWLDEAYNTWTYVDDIAVVPNELTD